MIKIELGNRNTGYADNTAVAADNETHADRSIDNNVLHSFNSSSSKYKYEYPKEKLDGEKAKYIRIPISIINDTDIDSKRVAVISYLRIHCGMNNVVGFTVSDMVEWCNGKPDRRINGSNSKYLDVIDDLNNRGYLTYIGDKSRSSYMKCNFDIEYFYEECDKGYGVIYLDEIRKIMEYRKDNSKDNYIINTNILLVFAYLRSKIKRRPNELNPEERSEDGILERRKRFSETYDSNICDIASDIGLSSKTVSKIIDVLEYELNLIVTDRAYRVKNKNGEFRTLQTIFANSYKRDGEFILITDENYSRNEIELKAESMKQYYQDYRIDKRKRKRKGENNSE